MKYDIKPNQAQIRVSPAITKKEIKAIKIDVDKKTITNIKISNSMLAVKKYLDIYEELLIPIEKDKNDCFIVGVDKDLKSRKSFTIKGISKIFNGNSIIVEYPKSNDNEKLKSTKILVQAVREMIVFEE